jgi:gamma-glutamyltranspeptidase/glutathione hydrolase
MENPASSGASRPIVSAMRHAVVAGHHFATQAGFQILEAGGNAVDAGVAAGMALGVLEPVNVSFGGVAPILVYMAKTREVTSISGLGWWPRAATPDYFMKHHGGKIPEGVLRTVIPAAPAAWIEALENYGTMSFAEVAAGALSFARDGFPMYSRLAKLFDESADKYARWPSSVAHFYPAGRAPETGRIFRQPDLGKTIAYMVDEEAAHRKDGRLAGLKAARDAFYRGDIAATMVAYHKENGGLVTAQDLAEFRVEREAPVKASYDGTDVYVGGPWCQGPMLLQALNLLKGSDLAGLGHNSTAYIHLLTEALKLAAADREAYYGDPKFVDVPMTELLSDEYSAERRLLLRTDRAWPEMPPAGRVNGQPWRGGGAEMPAARTSVEAGASAFDTTYVCAIDREGNVFSATPSDSSRISPIIPGLGFAPSSRGVQSRADPEHIASVAPGKRPRLTPCPALAMKQGEFVMPFGTPGGDIQTQSMLQVFLNIHALGMDPQSAVEAPRFASYSFPSWFAPYDYHPGLLCLESRIPETVGAGLEQLGHRVSWWPGKTSLAGSVSTILRDERSGVMHAAADPRRDAYALGW